MDLILKISDRCNFACKFCSSNEIAVDHKDLSLDKVTAFLLQYGSEVNNIIVNGGDPLMVDPQWYYDLIDWLNEHDLKDINISFTTNLLDFWRHPKKWTDLFKNHVSVCTSFQYGDERVMADGKVYTEEMFREVFAYFEKTIGYKLKFIAVINENNAHTAIQTVKLARELGTTCRINPALRSGRTTKPFSFYEMMKIWLLVIRAGLGDYEDNCKLLLDIQNGRVTECPFNSFCHSSIRCMSPDGTVHTCPAIADDILKGVDDAYTEGTARTNKQKFQDLVLKTECYECKLFHFCNSCTKRILDIHEMGEEWLDHHCKGMKSLQDLMEKYFREDYFNVNVSTKQ